MIEPTNYNYESNAFVDLGILLLGLIFIIGFILWLNIKKKQRQDEVNNES